MIACYLGACKRGAEPEKQGEASSGASSTKSAQKVKLQLDWVPEPEFGGFYAAREGGVFEKAGLAVEITAGGAGVPVVQMVATGQADFGTANAEGVLVARARGADVIPIFATFQTSPQGIMVHKARGAKTMAEALQSGTLAVELGASYVSFLKKKYTLDKLKIVPYDGGVARFVAGPDFSQQCFITSEPIAAAKQGSDPQVFLIADEGFNPYSTVVITRGALWKEKPELVRAFVRATREGWRAYLDAPQKTNELFAKLNTAFDADTLTKVSDAQKPLIETEETKKTMLGAMSRERWTKLSEQLVELGTIEKAPPVDEYLVPIEPAAK